MTLRRAYIEAQRLAVDVEAFPVPGTSDTAAQFMRLGEALAVVSGQVRMATEGLEEFGKAPGWWAPPRNLAFRPTALGASLWTFTILPHFPAKRAYREDLNAIVVRPTWRLLSVFGSEDARTASEQLRTGPTISATVDKELSWIEGQFGITIPTDLRAGLVAGSVGQACLRWGINPLKIRDRLIPLDGAVPRDLP